MFGRLRRIVRRFFTIRNKLILSFAVIFALVLSGYALTYQALSRIRDTTQQIHSTYLHTQEVRQFETLLPRIVSFAEEFLTDPSIDTERLVVLTQHAMSIFVYLETLPLDTADQRQLKRMELHLQRMLQDILRERRQATDESFGAASQNQERVKRSIRIVVESYDQILTRLNVALAQINQQAETIKVTSTRQTIAIVAGTILSGCFVLWFLLRSIQSPLNQLIDAIQRIAGGEYHHRVHLQTPGAIGKLANNFNLMTIRLQRSHILHETAMEHVEGIMASMNSLLIVISPKEVIETVNPAALKELGYSESELVGQPIATILDDDLDPFRRDILRPALQRGSVAGVELRLVTNTGRRFTVLLSCSAIRRGAKQCSGFVCVAQQISEEYQRLLTQAKQASGAASQGYTRAIAALHNVLTTALQDGTAGTIAGETHTRLARQAALIINNALALPMADTDLCETNLNSVARQVVAILQENMTGNPVSMHAALADDLWPVAGHPDLFRQLLMNLGLNACEAMPKGGELIVETQNCRLDADFCRLQPELAPGRYVRVGITDTGLGIPKDALPTLGTRFTSTKTDHAGLGLSIARQTMSALDSTMIIQSEPGQGTTIQLYFAPLTADDHASLDIVSDILYPSALEGTILVVDDEAVMRNFAREVLELRGASVLFARNGAEAVTLYKKHREQIRLVLLDVTMPKVDGLETYKKLKKIDPGVRVLFCSGYLDPKILAELSPESGVDLIHKPYPGDELLKKISTML